VINLFGVGGQLFQVLNQARPVLFAVALYPACAAEIIVKPAPIALPMSMAA